MSSRDLWVVAWVSEMYAIRTDQLALLLGRGERAAQRCIERLHAAGLVESRRILAGEPGWVWLTGRGQRAAGNGFRPWRPNVTLLSHIAAVNSVRMFVQSRAVSSEWVSERAIARDQPSDAHTPDGVLMIEGRAHAIEVELTMKSRRRVEAIVTELCASYDQVVYFCAPATMRQLEGLAQDGRWPSLALRPLPPLEAPRLARAPA
ncbi:MAG: replication-relaxation family protein [Actinobacteria bacterium]|nr:replication-relaxation family protein [Actinomycetota bacterium]